MNKTNNLFCTDLDNTLICGIEPAHYGVCVAEKDGKKASYMTNDSYDKFVRLCDKIQVLFITTRCRKSYENIYLKKYVKKALVDNGAVLVSFKHEEEEEWLAESRRLIETDVDNFNQARAVHESYGYTEKWGSEFVLDYLNKDAGSLDFNALKKDLSVFEDCLLLNIGHTSCVVTYKKLSKGINIKRYADKFKYSIYLTAGDGKEDVSMFEYSELSIGKEGSGATCFIQSSKLNNRLDFCNFVVGTAYELID